MTTDTTTSNGNGTQEPGIEHPFRVRPGLPPEGLAEYVCGPYKRPISDSRPDPKLAYALALVSGWSYAKHETVVKHLRYRGVEADVTYIECENDAMLVVATAYFLRSKCGRLGILSFRGTEPVSLINWLTDTNSTLRPFPFGYGKIHSGFFANFDALWDDTNEILHAAADNRYPKHVELPVLPPGEPPSGRYKNELQALYITGHSLGAAMAVVAAAALLLGGGRRHDWSRLLRGIYTYGQPMVGDATFVKECQGAFDNKLFRYVFNDDLVPRMPPRTIGDFVHFGQRLYSGSTTEVWDMKEARDEAPTLIETIGSAMTSFVVRRLGYGKIMERVVPLPYSLDDHMPTNYIEVSRITADR
jgi:Lipase (class 3)